MLMKLQLYFLLLTLSREYAIIRFPLSVVVLTMPILLL
jgi:hypothetical protein